MSQHNREQAPSAIEEVRRMAEQGTLNKGVLSQDGRKVTVSIDKLEEDPHNERKNFTDMEELIASLRENGMLEPIVATPIDGDKYRIVYGHRRYRAAKEV